MKHRLLQNQVRDFSECFCALNLSCALLEHDTNSLWLSIPSQNKFVEHQLKFWWTSYEVPSEVEKKDIHL